MSNFVKNIVKCKTSTDEQVNKSMTYSCILCKYNTKDLGNYYAHCRTTKHISKMPCDKLIKEELTKLEDKIKLLFDQNGNNNGNHETDEACIEYEELFASELIEPFIINTTTLDRKLLVCTGCGIYHERRNIYDKHIRTCNPIEKRYASIKTEIIKILVLFKQHEININDVIQLNKNSEECKHEQHIQNIVDMYENKISNMIKEHETEIQNNEIALQLKNKYECESFKSEIKIQSLIETNEQINVKYSDLVRKYEDLNSQFHELDKAYAQNKIEEKHYKLHLKKKYPLARDYIINVFNEAPSFVYLPIEMNHATNSFYYQDCKNSSLYKTVKKLTNDECASDKLFYDICVGRGIMSKYSGNSVNLENLITVRIIGIYKTKLQDKQTFWCTDISRCAFIIRIIEDDTSVWKIDSKVTELKKLLIYPIVNYFVDAINLFQLFVVQNELLNLERHEYKTDSREIIKLIDTLMLSFNWNEADIHTKNIQSRMQHIDKTTALLSSDKFIDKIIKRIAPYFYFNHNEIDKHDNFLKRVNDNIIGCDLEMQVESNN